MEVPWIIVSLWTRAILGQSYLAAEHQHRPLWILEDGLTKRHRQNRPEADYETTTRMPALVVRRQGRGGGQEAKSGSITFLVRHEDREAPAPPPPPPPPKLPSIPQRRFMMPHHLQLPHRYVQPVQRTRSHRRGERRQLPVFDNGPGENSLQLGMRDYPIFVYNGTRGELILNTMLSRRRYPMQEPVPGQVLYPPSTPMFRPKPIVERFRFPGQRELMNLTLIPFYAQEAISDPALTSTSTQAPTISTSTTPIPSPSPYETQLPRIEGVLALGKRKRKKAKQYEAFHSPQEVVQWQPVLRRSTGHNDNHRHHSSEEVEPDEQKELVAVSDGVEEALDEQDWLTAQEAETEVELPPELPTETSTASSSEPFQIVYFDESLERPAVEALSPTTPPPPPPPLRQSSRYALKREYYAFPVYTLGKLLQPQAPNPSKNLLEKSDRAARSSLEREPSTWFILNSRYKGPYHRSHGTDTQTKYYTSKYIENGLRSLPRR
ncbi:uncharacterized protein LOC122623702 [Drosophila teissieri]|uniref:uncharacterized protein LOC122623702 n=1 Tax=Drosophila teissieri TaxID=7243 RepID=UPI001CBA352F|nr:uncharacterized protein LOC122623702 [Drosophila teissieri]